MIYRLYYRPGSLREDPDEARRYRDILLRYAFFHEKQLIFDDQIIVRNEWGKPAVQSCPQIQYNVSHCKGLVSCIFADAPVGIDVEYIRPFSPYAAQHVLSEQEMEDLRCAPDPDRRFFVYWTLKESCVKAMGTGLATPMKQVVFRVEDDTVECITQPGYRFLLLESSGPYITAACFLGGGNSARICEKDDGGIYGKIFQIETASL